ncbi:E3 ubiquitin-protein ligase UPL7, partial [Sesamum angolense]
MNESRKHQVSLRGASAKEITRDALLERVNQERELRNYTRRANAAALLIQRVWRRHHETQSVALQLRQEWEVMMNNRAGAATGMQLSKEILRPFLFFINYLSVRCGKIGARDRDCMINCFRILLDGITSKGRSKGEMRSTNAINCLHIGLCAVWMGINKDKNVGLVQVTTRCTSELLPDGNCQRVQDVALTSTAMRLSVLLTDAKSWNCIADDACKDANNAVKNLVQFIGILCLTTHNTLASSTLACNTCTSFETQVSIITMPQDFTGSYTSSLDSGKFTEGLDYASYIHVVILLADNLLASLENFGRMTRNTEELQAGNDTSAESVFHMDETTCGFSNLFYMDLFKPIFQQWHLKKLLAFEKDASGSGTDNLPSTNQQYSWNLWGELEKSLFQQKKHIVNSKSLYANAISGDISDGVSDGRQKRFGKDTGYKWANVLQKITGKAPTENVFVDSINSSSNFSQTEEDPSDKWDIEPLRRGPEGISRDIACLLLLFCSTYSHLLLILDDIEFYEKQHRAIVDSAVRCLHLLYERDCRSKFCHPSLWLSPGKNNRMPIAVAARTHEVSSGADGTASSSMGSVITTMPHVFPFEERYKFYGGDAF